MASHGKIKKIPPREVHCGTKIPHDTIEQAIEHLREMGRLGLSGYKYYQCEYCHKYHIGTHSPKK